MIGFGIFIIFTVAALLMFLRKLPAILALPFMAAAIGLLEWAAGRLTLEEISYAIFADGALRLSEPVVITMFGGMLSHLMQKTGVAEKLIRAGAELSGDRPWFVSIMTLFVVAFLFTATSGLGAVIMVGTIVLPILSSLGLREHAAGAIVLFGISLGGMLNPANWALYTNVLKLDVAEVSFFAFELAVIVAFFSILFITFELWVTGWLTGKYSLPHLPVRRVVLNTGIIILSGYVCITLYNSLNPSAVWTFMKTVAGLILLIAFAGNFIDILRKGKNPAVRWHAFLIPLVPFLLIFFFQVPFVPAFMMGLFYGVLSTLRKGSLNLAVRAVVEGSQNVAPALALMLGIGMVLSAILGPSRNGPGKRWYETPARTCSMKSETQVSTAGSAGVSLPASSGSLQSPETSGTAREWPVPVDMKPVLSVVVPADAVRFVLIFSLLAPLALYRGPLNVWGLGCGIGTLLVSTGVPPGAVMGILMSVGVIQGVSDPTNTQNVWIAGEVRVDVNTLLRTTILFTWPAAIAGLLLTAFRFYV